MISPFISKETWLHRWPAGVKLAVLASMSLLVLPMTDWRVLMFGCMALIGVYVTFGGVGRSRLVGLRGIALLIAVLGVVQALLWTWPDSNQITRSNC